MDGRLTICGTTIFENVDDFRDNLTRSYDKVFEFLFAHNINTYNRYNIAFDQEMSFYLLSKSRRT